MSQYPMHILIPTFGRPTLLERTLVSIAEADLPESLVSVWVIENGPPAGAKAICERVAGLPLRYAHHAQAGKSRALQWAVEQINQGLLVFFDDDVRLAPGALQAYNMAAATHGPGHFFGGPLPVDYEQPPVDWLRPHLPVTASGWDPASFEHRAEDGACFQGPNMAMFAQDILQAGGFNERVGPGATVPGTCGNPVGQETWMQAQLLARGAKPVFVPEARVWHYVPADRCSPRWALHRKYRGCMTYGLLRLPDDPDMVSWGPLPRWMWVKLALSAPAMLASYLAPAARQRFELRLPWYRYRGYAAGWRMRTQPPEATVDQAPSTLKRQQAA